MSERQAQVIVLCEDKQQQVFCYRVLKALGFPPRRIYLRPIPAGRQSAEQYVREQYPMEVSLLRRKAHHLAHGLLAALDADTGTTSDHHRELDTALQHAGQDSRRQQEPIMVFIPKRNIETWIAYLTTAEDVSEDQVYPKLSGSQRACQAAVARFVQLTGATVPAKCPPSLCAGLAEMPRLDALNR